MKISLSRYRLRVFSATSVVAISAVVLSGCATSPPTVTSKTAFVIYDVKPSATASYQNVVSAFISGSKKYLSNENVQENPPPYPLPAQAGRFQSQNAGQMQGMSGLAGMMAAAGAQMPNVVSCPGASVTATGVDTDFSKYGKTAHYTFCLYPYKAGYQVDVVGTYTSRSGMTSNPLDIGADIGSMVTKAVGLGTPASFVSETFANMENKLKATGSTVAVVSEFNPFQKTN